MDDNEIIRPVTPPNGCGPTDSWAPSEDEGNPTTPPEKKVKTTAALQKEDAQTKIHELSFFRYRFLSETTFYHLMGFGTAGDS